MEIQQAFRAKRVNNWVVDIWSPEKRSEVMSLIRGQGTKPELALQGIVRKALPRWKVETHPRALAGRPDLFVPSLRLAIFVEGCFWHSCPRHGKVPQTNVDYWIPKLEATVSRDRRVERRLRGQGISVWHVWEHDLRPARLRVTSSALSRRLQSRAAALGAQR